MGSAPAESCSTSHGQPARPKNPSGSTRSHSPHGDPVQSEPARHLPERTGQRGNDPTGVHPRLGEHARHPQHPARPVRLEVHPRDELPVEQEREHVVAVGPLRLGDVDLDAVAEPEEALGALAVPDQRVERAQQRGPLDAARQARIVRTVGGLPPPADRDGLDLPRSASSATARRQRSGARR